MNRALVLKSLRETWVAILLFSFGVAGVETLFAAVLPTFGDEISGIWRQLGFVQNIIESLLGAELGESMTADTMAAIAWVHPILLVMIWAHEINFCTRLPAGEIDRATIDIVMGLPVSRMRLFLCESLVWLVTGATIITAALAGNLLGQTFVPPELRPHFGRVLIVLVNLMCLYVAVGGLVWLVSSLSNRRGRAVGVTVAALVASFLLNFLVPFWQPAKLVSFVSVLDHHRPWQILTTGAWPLGDMAALLIFGTLTWSMAAVIFCRRDICTV